MIQPIHLREFRARLGDAGVLEPSDGLVRYETAARYGGGRAACVLRPASTAEVAAVVAYCVRQGLAFVPQSGNTGLTLASTPDATGAQIVLSLERLASPLDVSPADRTATVGAGVRLSALNAALEPFGLFLPIDLAADPMVGGMVATNTGGARFIRYGDMRRHVLGLEVVLADDRGTVLDLMSDLRKDNTKLDLKHLFIGSSGAFGIVTKAVLEVHPRPASTATALLVPRDDDAVLEVLLGLERRVGWRLSAFEGISGAALAHAFAHVPRLRNPFARAGLPDFVVLVELSSEGEGASTEEVLIGAVGELAEGARPSVIDAYFDGGREFWAIRHAVPEGLRAAGRVVGLDLSLARSRIMPFRKIARAGIAQAFPQFEVCDFGHVGDGGLHFNLLARPDVPDDRIEAVRRWVLDRAVRDHGGSFSGEHGLGPNVQAEYDRFSGTQSRSFAGRIQAAFGVRTAARIRLADKP